MKKEKLFSHMFVSNLMDQIIIWMNDQDIYDIVEITIKRNIVNDDVIYIAKVKYI